MIFDERAMNVLFCAILVLWYTFHILYLKLNTALRKCVSMLTKQEKMKGQLIIGAGGGGYSKQFTTQNSFKVRQLLFTLKSSQIFKTKWVATQ